VIVPDKPARSSVKVECSSCHKDQGAACEGALMARSGVTCVDCHGGRDLEWAALKAGMLHKAK